MRAVRGSVTGGGSGLDISLRLSHRRVVQGLLVGRQKVLVNAALSYWCMRPYATRLSHRRLVQGLLGGLAESGGGYAASATSVCGLKLLAYAVLSC